MPDEQKNQNMSGETGTSSSPSPVVRDILGGDEGKEVPLTQALGDSLEKKIATSDSLPSFKVSQKLDDSISQPIEASSAISDSSTPPVAAPGFIPPPPEELPNPNSASGAFVSEPATIAPLVQKKESANKPISGISVMPREETISNSPSSSFNSTEENVPANEKGNMEYGIWNIGNTETVRAQPSQPDSAPPNAPVMPPTILPILETARVEKAASEITSEKTVKEIADNKKSRETTIPLQEIVVPTTTPIKTDVDVSIPTQPTTPTHTSSPLSGATPSNSASHVAIRTLHSDLQNSVRDNNMSLTSIALAQQEKSARLPFIAEEKKSFWSAWSVGALALVVGGIVIVGAAIFFVAKTNIPLPFIPSEPLAPTLVAVESQETLDITRMTRVEARRQMDAFITAAYSSPVRIEALIIEETIGTSTEKTVITVERFFDLVNTRAPGKLVRSIGPDMTFGRVGDTPFLMTTAPSYENTFAGMLEWESFLATDLDMITRKTATSSPHAVPDFSLSAPSTESATSTATSTLAEPAPSVTPPPMPDPVWKDIIVKNNDVRALMDHTGKPLILYSFPKEGLLLITQTREAAAVITEMINSPVFGR